jgi:cysteine desulfurase
MSATIYLDNNATAPPAPAVLAAMHDCLRDCWGNPSSMHRVGAAAKERLATARGQVAALIGATPPEIVFTGSATEANHMAILGALALSAERRHIVASLVEHPSTLLLLRHLQASGVRVTWVGVDAQGRLDLDELAAAIMPDTALVSLMWANNETGVIFPVAEAARLAKSRGVLFHTDAVQAAGRLVIDVKQVPVDLLSIAGHKLHAAKGVGALYVRKGVKLPPLLFGHQERGRRGGTENVAGIAGMGVAAELAAQTLAQDAVAVAALRDRLERGLIQCLPQAQVNAADAPRLPNTSSVRLATIDSEIILDRLDRAGICASSGSACTAGGTMPSHVLLAMGLSSQEALATVRFSLSRYNRAEEIDTVLETLVAIVPPLLGLAA